MNGLTSREALAHRQARWVQDIDREVRSNPVQSVFNRDSLHNSVYNSVRDKPSIISVMSDDYDSIAMDSSTALKKRDGINSFVNESQANQADQSNQSNQLDSLQKLCDGLNERLIRLEKSHESLEGTYDSLKEDYGSLKESHNLLKKNHESLEKSIAGTVALIARIQKLEEHSNSQLEHSTDDKIIPVISNPPVATIPQPVLPKVVPPIIPPKLTPNSKILVTTKPELKNIREFIPYMIKEEYAGRDNITRLSGNDLDMVVEIIGRHTEPFVIFPFGSETNIPEYSPCLLEFTCDGISSIKGFFGRGIDRVYTIRLEDEFKVKIMNHTFPLVLKCKANLV